jgi:acyl carrier protein
MNRNDILKTINNIFIDALDNNTITLTETTTAFDVEEWDSLNHVIIAESMEKYFKIKFTSQEIVNWNNVGEMIDTIQKKAVV